MKIKSQSGSVLLSTLSFIILLAVAAASILELTMNSYKLTMRNEMRAQARAVAESELENIYFQWVTQIMSAVPAAETPTALAAIADVGDVPLTVQPAFLAAHRNQGWVVRRSIGYNPAYDYYDGIIPNTTKQGKVTYVTVRIEVLPNSSSYFRNELSVRVGRRFASTNTSIFQYGLFYQGDLEMAPGNGIEIDGDVAANGSIYLAAAAVGGRLQLDRKVRYLSGNYYNKDSLGNTVLRKPNTQVTGSLIAPVFLTSELSQVETMSEPENLLGGIDAAELMSRRPDLFPTENDVYRAAILPPPDQTDEYPTADSMLGDDPTINVQRMYTRSGLRVTVNTDNTVTFTKADGTDVSVALNAAGIIVGTPNTDMYDQRELKNVKMTTIDMHALMTAVQSNFPSGSGDFNGALYINLKSSNSTTPRGVKLINGQDVNGRAGHGTSVTTNGGVYVQGNFNTVNNVLPSGKNSPAMIMGDQITALSSGWNDSNAASDISLRPASGPLVLNAGILTGNTPATLAHASGGAQNLIRYLEDWKTVNGGSGYTVSVLGALGRLFTSKTFNSYFAQPGQVYQKPSSRDFHFDRDLLTDPPAGSPTTTAFSRGSFFVW